MSAIFPRCQVLWEFVAVTSPMMIDSFLQNILLYCNIKEAFFTCNRKPKEKYVHEKAHKNTPINKFTGRQEIQMSNASESLATQYWLVRM